MISTVAFLEQLRAIGVRLSLTDDKLHIQAPRGALTPELRDQLQERGNEVATYLREMRDGMEKLPPIVCSELISAELIDSQLSFNQQHVWHKHNVSNNPARFNIPTLLELNGPLHIESFEAAFEAVIARHASLRTVIIEIEGEKEPRQRILPSVNLSITHYDLCDEPITRRKAVLQQKVALASKQSFSITSGPLIHAYLFRTDEETHSLLIVAHQLIFDLRSLTVVLSNWSLFYQQIVTAAEFDLPPRPFAPNDGETVEYGDYVSWQRWPGMYDTQIKYWREELADFAYGPPIRCLLPTDWARPAIQNDRGSRETLRLDPELTNNLKELADQQGVTLRMLMLTAYKLLLARLSGLDEVVVGTLLPARTQVAMANVVGYFANTIVLRTDVRDDPTFTQLLRRVAQISLGAQDNQDVPFSRMLEALRSEGNLRAGSLVQVFFDMPVYPKGLFSAEHITSTLQPIPEPTVLYDLTLNVTDDADGLTLDAVYRRELFTPTRMQEVLRQLEFILMQAVVAKERATGSFSLSHTPPTIPTHTPNDYAAITDYVEQQVRNRGDKTAIADGEFCLSYSELSAKANQIANHLRNQGVATGDRVVIVASRSAALAPTLLGVLKSGAAFAVLDPTEPTRLLATRLAELQSKAAIIIQEADPLPVLLEQCLTQIDVVFRYAIDESLPADSTRPPEIEIRLDTTAYIAFSKETPEQLPVEVTHRALAHMLDWQREQFSLKSGDRFGLLASLGSDTLLRDVLLPIMLGASLYVPSRTELSVQLSSWLTRKRITTCNMAPAQMDKLLLSLAKSSNISALRTLFVCDGRLQESQVRTLRIHLPRVEIVALYGTAESSLLAGYHMIPASGLLLENDTIPLGQGIGGFDLLVLTENGQLAGIGELGEIYVRSPYLAQGYLNRPKLTAIHFVMSRRFGRLWRSRDFGRIRPDGLIEHVPAD